MALTIEQFGQRVKQKYPQYKDIEDGELGQKVLDKYPQYQKALSVDKPSNLSAEQTTERRSNLLQGIAKPFLKTATSGLNFLEGTSKLLSGDVKGANESTTRERNFGILGSVRPVGVQKDGKFGNTGQFAKDVIGTGLEIGSYATPGAVGLGAKTALTAGKPALTTLGNIAMGSAKAGVIGGGAGSLGSALQENKNLSQTIDQTLGGAITGGVLGGAIPLGGALARGTTREIGKFGAQVLGRSTGAGEMAIMEAFNNPNVIKFARKAGKEGSENLTREALEEARNGLDIMTSSNSIAYREAMDRILESPQDFSLVISSIRSKIVRQATEGFGIRFIDGKKLNTLDFNASDVVEGTASVQRAFDRLFAEPISSVKELDRIKKSLGRIANGTPARSPAQALIYQMKDAVNRTLKEDVPGYADEMGRFSDAAELADEIQKTLSLGDKAMEDTAIRKLMSTMRQNNEIRNHMLGVIGKTGGRDILGKIAGVTLASRAPRGLAGTLQPSIGSGIAIGGGIAILTPSSIPMLLLFLASTSPRLMAEAVTLIAKIKNAKMIPLQIQKALRNILIQASREAVNSEQAETP